MSNISRTAIFMAVGLSMSVAPIMQAYAQAGQGTGSTGCPQVGAAIVGGFLGALVGKKNRAVGAAVGAVAGSLACAVVNASSKQTKSADATLREYRQNNNGQVPDRVVLMTYASSNPPAVPRDGRSEMQISSSGDIAMPPGTNAKFSEQLEIYAPGATSPSQSSSKQLTFGTGGGFVNSFSIPFQKEFPQGTYTYKTRLVMNGNQVLGEQQGTFQAV